MGNKINQKKYQKKNNLKKYLKNYLLSSCRNYTEKKSSRNTKIYYNLN